MNILIVAFLYTYDYFLEKFPQNYSFRVYSLFELLNKMAKKWGGGNFPQSSNELHPPDNICKCLFDLSFLNIIIPF